MIESDCFDNLEGQTDADLNDASNFNHSASMYYRNPEILFLRSVGTIS